MSRNYWQEEYKVYLQSAQWKAIKNQTENLAYGRCVMFPWLKCANVHHMHYGNIQGERQGNSYVFTCKKDTPIKDIVPLSRLAHKIVHLSCLWKNKKNRKTVNFILRVLYILNLIYCLPFKVLNPRPSKYIKPITKTYTSVIMIR